MKEKKLESIFIRPNEDKDLAYRSVKTLGYEFLVSLMPSEGREEAAWAVPNIEELKKICSMLNDDFWYKIHPLETIIDWESLNLN
ncbi:MAG: hypothetical protein JWP12_1590 [Bacteroidetes bacterium]|nr:hypothetical protein [Bacteroidota bacterium]